MQQTYPASGHCLVSSGSDGGAQIGTIRSAQNASAQKESPGLPGLDSKADERIQTVDIHVGNMTSTDPQLTESQGFVTIDDNARSKYAARNDLRIKRISVFAVGEWPRDPDHVVLA